MFLWSIFIYIVFFIYLKIFLSLSWRFKKIFVVTMVSPFLSVFQGSCWWCHCVERSACTSSSRPSVGPTCVIITSVTMTTPVRWERITLCCTRSCWSRGSTRETETSWGGRERSPWGGSGRSSAGHDPGLSHWGGGKDFVWSLNIPHAAFKNCWEI